MGVTYGFIVHRIARSRCCTQGPGHLQRHYRRNCTPGGPSYDNITTEEDRDAGRLKNAAWWYSTWILLMVHVNSVYLGELQSLQTVPEVQTIGAIVVIGEVLCGVVALETV